MVTVCGAKDVSGVQLYRWRTTTARRDVFPFVCLYAAVALATMTCAPPRDRQRCHLSIVPRVRVRSLQGTDTDDHHQPQDGGAPRRRVVQDCDVGARMHPIGGCVY